MQQGLKFTESFTQITWLLLVLWFDITHTDIHHRDRHTDTHKQRYISIYKYVAAAICITLLNEQITDIKKLTYAAGLQ